MYIRRQTVRNYFILHILKPWIFIFYYHILIAGAANNIMIILKIPARITAIIGKLCLVASLINSQRMPKTIRKNSNNAGKVINRVIKVSPPYLIDIATAILDK